MVRRVGVSIGAVLSAVIGVFLFSALTSVSGAVAQADPIIGGIDVATAATDLQDDHVAVIQGTTDAAALKAVVDDARAKGLKLSVVSTGETMSEADAYDLAGALLKEVGGTVLVLSTKTAASQSDSLSDNLKRDADLAVHNAGSDDVAAARAYVNVAAASSSSSPWGLIIGIAAVVLVLGALYFVLHRRRSTAAHQGSEDLVQALDQRLRALAPQVVSLSDRVDAVGRPDLEARYDQASADYATLQQTIQDATITKPALDAAAASLSDLERRVAALDSEIDGLAPGMGTPSPAG